MNEKITIVALVGSLVLLNLLSYLYVSFASVIFLISFVLFASVLFIYRKNISGINFNHRVALISFVVVFVLLLIQKFLIYPLAQNTYSANFFRAESGWQIDIPLEIILFFNKIIVISLGLLGFAFLLKQTNKKEIKSEHILIFILLILILPFAVQNFFNLFAFTLDSIINGIPQYQFDRAFGSAASSDIGSLIAIFAVIILFNHFSKKLEYKSLVILLFLIGFIVSINDLLSTCLVYESGCPFTSFSIELIRIIDIVMKLLNKSLLFVGVAFITFLVSNKLMKKTDTSKKDVS